MALPSILKAFNVFYNGDSYLGEVSEIQLPKLSRKVEEYRSSGMTAPVVIDMGSDKLEISHTYSGFMRDILADWGVTAVGGVMLRFAGSYEADDTGTSTAVEIVVRGRHKELDMGKAKAGDKTEFKVLTSVSYYKVIVDGVTLIEMDPLNCVEIVDGVDRTAERRLALGI